AELRSTVNDLQSNIHEIQAKMATKEDLVPIHQAIMEIDQIVKRIEVNQERHEHILAILSKRSIEHEASIASLRHAQ
ncbi:hypothetical protein ABEV40_17775, partial [Geobacillus thermocatenulatus]